VLWGFVWLRLIRDKPQDAGWMSAESCGYLSQSLDREQWLLPQVASMKGAMRSATVVWLCIQYLLWSVGVYGFVPWLPTIIQKGAARGIGITGLLTAAPYLFAIICMLLVAHFSDRSLHRKRFVWPFLLCRSCSAWFVSDGGPKLLVGHLFFRSWPAAPCIRPMALSSRSCRRFCGRVWREK